MAGVDFNANLPTISTEDLRDVIKSVKDVYPWQGRFETLQAYQSHPAIDHMAAQRMDQQGGSSIMFALQDIGTGMATVTAPYTPDAVVVADTAVRGRVEWAQYTTNWGIASEEVSMNNAVGDQVFDLMTARRQDRMMQLADTLEEDFWGVPSTATPTHIYGIQYWMQPIATTQTADFNGTVPTGFSYCANVSHTTHTRWKNYNDRWDAAANFTGTITDADVQKMEQLLMYCEFRTPSIVPGGENTPMSMMKGFAGKDVMIGLAARARKNNDNLGNDVARFSNGDVVIQRVPVTWVRLLDRAATFPSSTNTYPLFFVNFNYLKFIVQSGWYLRESEPDKSPFQHNVIVTHVDLRGNFVCPNRQRLGGRLDAVVA